MIEGLVLGSVIACFSIAIGFIWGMRTIRKDTEMKLNQHIGRRHND